MRKWLAGAYSKAGITVNGVAPAVIQDTTMTPRSSGDLVKSEFISPPSEALKTRINILISRSNSYWTSGLPGRDRRDSYVDGKNGIRN